MINKEIKENNLAFERFLGIVWIVGMILISVFVFSCNTLKKLPCVNGTWVGHSDYYGDVTITRDCKGVYRIAREGSWLEVSKDSVSVWIDNGDKS